jgi:prepilin signal peptidase PulO-like enzyme (type II secretory pathway)
MAGETPPPGEPVHLPGPTYLPVIVAFGVTMIVAGVVINWLISVAGALITLIAVIRWIRETREEMGELPLEH